MDMFDIKVIAIATLEVIYHISTFSRVKTTYFSWRVTKGRIKLNELTRH